MLPRPRAAAKLEFLNLSLQSLKREDPSGSSLDDGPWRS